MKRRKAFVKRPLVLRLLVIGTIISILMPGGAVWAVNATAPLSTVVNPVFGTTGGAVPTVVPPHLARYIKDMDAAIKLGKALFWDMQVGSDGVTACATCHHRAGVDPIKHAEDADSIRDKNELNPGPNAGFDVVSALSNAAMPPNSALTAGDFNINAGIAARIAPAAGTNNFTLTAGVTGYDDVIGSQGVTKNAFVDIAAGSRFDQGTPVADTVFNSAGTNVRQVTGRNTPPTINAVFNFDNFWDGRANHIFNGNNPIGPMDAGAAGIWRTAGVLGLDATLVNEKVAVPNASLASQACGPPLSPVEMSFSGRTFTQLGKKMLSLTPLGIQTVSPNDSVLGPLSNFNSGKRGLNTTYPDMIKAAFVDNLWNSGQSTPAGVPQMEANFSLFWGLSVMCYEATLVSDQTPFDIFLGGGPALPTVVSVTGFISGSPNPATGNAVAGLGDFNGKCAVCHSGNEMTTASVSNIIGNSVTTIVISGSTITVPANSVTLAGAAEAPQNVNGITDTGFANIGVRPTGEDVGRGAGSGGNTDFPFPLSLAVQISTGNIPPGTTPTTQAGLAGVATAANASFKVPSIRNIELTAPYLHNGSAERLGDLVDIYIDGGFFDNLERSKAVQGAAAAGTKNDLVAFMLQLTDPRVKNETPPFDHPELIIPNGGPELHTMLRIPARDANGSLAPLPPVAAAAPATHNSTRLTVSGTKEAGADVVVSINSGPARAPDTVGDTTWSTTVTGLKAGSNTITVTANPVAPVPAPVSTALIATTNVTFPSGILTGGASASVTDALKALKITLGIVQATDADKANGDVAPLINGLPAPDGKLDLADVVVTLRKAVGLESF